MQFNGPSIAGDLTWLSLLVNFFDNSIIIDFLQLPIYIINH